jgi:hypothetical protein
MPPSGLGNLSVRNTATTQSTVVASASVVPEGSGEALDTLPSRSMTKRVATRPVSVGVFFSARS